MEIKVWELVKSSLPLAVGQFPPPPPPDGLWSVIVSAACDLLSSRWSGLSQTGLSRWSPSSGGGNESGLRLLLLSARSSTLFVSLVYLSGPPRLVRHDGSDTHPAMYACVHLTVSVHLHTTEPCVSLKLQDHQSAHDFIETDRLGFSPSAWFAPLQQPRQPNTWESDICQRPSTSVKSHQTHHDRGSSWLGWQGHKLRPSSLRQSFQEANVIAAAACCLSIFLLRELFYFYSLYSLLFKLEGSIGGSFRPTVLHTCCLAFSLGRWRSVSLLSFIKTLSKGGALREDNNIRWSRRAPVAITQQKPNTWMAGNQWRMSEIKLSFKHAKRENWRSDLLIQPKRLAMLHTIKSWP